jgi:hypothetical protein
MAVQHEVKILSSCRHVQIAASLLKTAREGAQTFGQVRRLVGKRGEASHEDELIELLRGQGGEVGCSVGIVSARLEQRLEGLAALTMGGLGPLVVQGRQVLGLENEAKTHPDNGGLGEDNARTFGEARKGAGGGFMEPIRRALLAKGGEEGGEGFRRGGKGGGGEGRKVVLEDGPTVGLEKGVGGEGGENAGPLAEGDGGDTRNKIFGARGGAGRAQPVDEQGELHGAVVGADGPHDALPQLTGGQALTQQ